MLKTILAPNASAMTLDGTQTYVVGVERVAVIDPGPADASHLGAIADAVAGAPAVILLTHQHPDHAAGADALAHRLTPASGDVPIRVLSAASGTLGDGTHIETDAGPLVALHTPGHTPDHVALHWPAESAIFVGDLMMGGLDTALVAPPEGDLRAYLASLDRLEVLRPRVLYPSHGPAFTDPAAALARYRAHRMARLDQVRQGLAAGLTTDGLLEYVYGAEIPAALTDFARDALAAYCEYLEGGLATP
jgi:hydroxyacylglutathione hydrolase